MKTLMALSIAGAALMFAGSALAEGACARPPAPTVADGANSTLEQMLASKNAVSAFMTASDTYQSCLLADLEAQRAAAKASKTKLDPAAVKGANSQISANQADKEQVGKAFNAAAKAYKAAHPS